jgi:hypothetical protein
MSLIFGAGFLLELLSASPEGAHSTTKFLRTMATVCASGRTEVRKEPQGSTAVLFRYRVAEGAAGVVAGEAGAAGVAGRVVDEPTVVPGAVLSATFGPLHGAHINIATIIAIAAMAPRIMPPRPVSIRPAARRLGLVLVVRLRFWSTLSISILLKALRSNRWGTQRFPPRSGVSR